MNYAMQVSRTVERARKLLGVTGAWSVDAPVGPSGRMYSFGYAGLISNLYYSLVGFSFDPSELYHVKDWYKEFEDKFEEYDSTKSYPLGTLLLRKPKDDRDYGNIAIVVSEEELISCMS